MNEAEIRAEHIDPALKAAGWGMVEGSAYDEGFVNTLTDFAPLVRTPQSAATRHLTGLKALEEHQTHQVRNLF